MLPDIRAAIAALFAAVGLLMIGFGAVATFRVAQDSHGALQADLAKRGRGTSPPSGPASVTVVATPGPHIAPFPPLPIVEVKDAPIAEVKDAPIAEVRDAPLPAPPSPPLAASVPQPAAEPPMGGPLAEAKPSDAERAAERAAKRAAAKKAREARLARQRKAAARRAAQARAKQQQAASPSYNGFGNSSFGAGAAKQ